MERIGEAHQVHQLQQQGVVAASFGVVEHSVVAAAAAAATKPRAPGLPPTPPASFAGQQRGGAAGDVCMDDSSGAAGRKQAQVVPAHRRTRSDVPFAGYFPPPTQQLPQPKAEAGGWGDGGGSGDDLFSSYLNLEGMDVLNSSSPDSSAKADSSENGDSEECAAWGAGAGVKRGAAGHARSLSVDSLMGRLNFASHGGAGGAFSLEFGNGEFSPAEMKKIMADEKLAEMALADPKRVKRVLANRQSAARSKERKMRYIGELEQKVHILQTEATTLAAQLNLLQRDSATVATQNNELRFRLQAMEQQAQLRDALNDALTGEVQRLKIMTAELGVVDSCSSNAMAQQHNHMFQQQQQATPIPFYQLQQHQQQQHQHHQQNGAANKHEARE